MESLRRFQAILLADLRERVRSRRFWLVIAATAGLTWFCFPPDGARYIIVGINTYHRGAYSSAWIGMVLAMLSIWTSLIGFYLVRGNLRRDFDSGVWELLEVTPLSRASYLMAKWSSHVLVLSLVLLAQLAVGLVAQLVRAEDLTVDLPQLIVPALLFGLPSLALTAMLAIWFDLVPPLRRAAGNYLYFVVWVAIMAATIKSVGNGPPPGGNPQWLGDPRGVAIFNRLIHERLENTLRQPLRVCIGCGFPDNRPVTRFDWPSWQPTPAELAGRLAWLAIAVAGVLGGAPFVDRFSAFDRTRSGGGSIPARARADRWLHAMLRPMRRTAFGTLYAAELLLGLHGRKLWWWMLVPATMGLQLFGPPRIASVAVLAAWVLLTDILSRSSLREAEAGTGAVVFSAAHALPRILAARWLGLVTLGWIVTAPAMLRFAASAPIAALAIAIVSVSLATWAMALGATLRTSRVAELLLCGSAYLGIQDAPLLNVAVAPGWTAGVHLACLPIAAALLLFGWPRAHAQPA